MSLPASRISSGTVHDPPSVTYADKSTPHLDQSTADQIATMATNIPDTHATNQGSDTNHNNTNIPVMYRHDTNTTIAPSTMAQHPHTPSLSYKSPSDQLDHKEFAEEKKKVAAHQVDDILEQGIMVPPTAGGQEGDQILAEVEDDHLPPMDKSPYGYIIVFCSFSIYFVVFGTEHTFGVYQEFYATQEAPDFLHDQGPQGIALIGTLAATFTYLFGAYSGRFADIAGYRISVLLGAILMALGMLGASFANNMATLYICQGLILGLGSSLVYLPAVSCPAHWFDRYRSIAIGIVVCGSGLGGLALGPLCEYLIAHVGFRWTLRIQALICLVGIGGSGMFLKPRIKRKKVSSTEKKPTLDLSICKDTEFIVLAVANFLTSLGYMTPFFFISTYAVFNGMTASTGALLIGLLNGASLLGRLSLGFVTDRVGRINMLFFCSLVSGLSILCLWPFASKISILCIFAVFYGFSCGGYYTVIPSVIAEIYGLDRLTTVTGLLYGSIGFGYLIGSPVSGVLLDMTKPNTTYIWVIVFSGASMTAASLAIFYLKFWATKGKWWKHA